MKSHFKLICLLLLCTKVAIAQTSGDNELNFNGHAYSVFIIKIDTASVKNFKLVQNVTGIPHKDFIAPYINSDPNIFITNACVWDASYNPLGLFESDGKIINPLNLTDGNAVGFYLKPNGALLISDKDAVITESSKVSGYSNINVGVQSGPMLVIAGQIHDKFDPKSKNKNFRCGVGLYNDHGAKYLVFVASNEPVTLYDFATLFKSNYKCENALCLQSAGCAMYTPFIDRKNAVDNGAIGSYIIYQNHP